MWIQHSQEPVPAPSGLWTFNGVPTMNITVRDRLNGWNRDSTCTTRAAVRYCIRWRSISSNLGLRVE